MNEFGPDIILDAGGNPIGRYRDNQDPADAQRLHPVPRVNSKGEPIMDAGEPVVVMLPLDNQKVAAVLAADGMTVADDGISIVTIAADTIEG